MRQLLYSFGMVILTIYQPFPSIMGEPMRGHNMLPADVPFIASLALKQFDDTAERNHFCTGSLITEYLVVTASHCFDGLIYDVVDVVIGAADLKDAGPKYNVHWWIKFERWAKTKHPQLCRHEKKDIAIVKLKRKVRQPGVVPANITPLKNPDLYEKNATLIGWLKGPENIAPRFLTRANVQILNTTECERRHEIITNDSVRLPRDLFCSAASSFTVVTKGDSGGPLLDENNDILGINRSFCDSDTCNRELVDENTFTFHTEFIDEYRQFIDAVKAYVKSS